MRYAVLIALVACLSFDTAAQESQVFKVAQVMPTVETCKEAKDPGSQRACMQKFLEKHFAQTLKYPRDAENAGMEGIVLLEFIIRKDGEMDAITIKEDPGYGMGDEAVKAMKKLKKEWVAGSNHGEPVDVQMVMPVYFKLPEKAEETVDAMPEKPDVYMIADEMPRFAGCEEMDAREARTCTRDKSIAYITKNLRYPEEAKEAGIEGDVHAEFIIDEEGKVTEPRIIKGLHEACDAEVIRVISSMPDWNPGQQDGKPVKVKQMLPFRFRLPAKDR